MLEATHYTSIGRAVAATPPGNTLYVAAGEYRLPAGGLRIDKPIRIIGDGPGTLLWVTGGSPGIVIGAGVEGLRFADFQIKTAKADSKHGVMTVPVPGRNTADLRFERLIVASGGGDGFHLDGSAHVTLTDCAAIRNAGVGLYLRNAGMVRVLGGPYGGNGRHGIFADACPAVRIWGVSLEANQQRGTDPVHDAQLRLRGCHGFSVQGLHVEGFSGQRPSRTGVCVESCLGGEIGSGVFGNPTLVAGSRGIVALDSRAVELGPMHASNLDVYAEFIRCERVKLGRQAGHGAEGRVLGLPQ